MQKMSAPLPNIEGILHQVAHVKYQSLINGKDVYKQIWIVSEHVHCSTVTTPDGNMVSLILQQGDCNAPAMYQALINYIFSLFISVFMDVYLDDVVIYSNSLEDHVRHVKMIIDVLKQEQLYLSASKLKFLPKDMKILGCVVNKKGIQMNPDKVDCI